MAMEQIGYVTAAEQDLIRVRVARESACGGHCASCKGCPSDAVVITGKNDAQNPYTVGEQVLVVMPTKHFLKGTAGSYGTLTVLMLLGGILGYKLGNTELFSVLGAGIGLAVGTWLIKRMFANSQTEIRIERQRR